MKIVYEELLKRKINPEIDNIDKKKKLLIRIKE